MSALLHHTKGKFSLLKLWCIYCKPTLYPLCFDWFSRVHAIQGFWRWKVKIRRSCLSFTWRKSLFFCMFWIMKQLICCYLNVIYSSHGCKMHRSKYKSIGCKKEACCFLTHTPLERRRVLKFNLANYIHQNCFNMYCSFHWK